MELTSKLIDGNFPPYERVIPSGNDKVAGAGRQGIRAGRGPRLHHLRRQDPRGEAQHRQGQGDACRWSIRNPARPPRKWAPPIAPAPLEIGFNARYLLDITGQIEGKEVRFLLSDAGSPAHHRRRGGRAHALRPHAAAGLTFDAARFDRAIPACIRIAGSRRAGGDAARCSPISAPMRRRACASAARPVVLAGPNGAGKTNLLDAISLLSPGRGLRGASWPNISAKVRNGCRATRCGRWRRR